MLLPLYFSCYSVNMAVVITILINISLSIAVWNPWTSINFILCYTFTSNDTMNIEMLS
jgi:hypothetical protein